MSDEIIKEQESGANVEDYFASEAEEKFKCEDCQDTGIISKTEWTGTDDSHEVEFKCHCQKE